MNTTFKTLREKHPALIYKEFKYEYTGIDEIHVTYEFILEPDLQFKPTLTLPFSKKHLSEQHLKNALFNLGIVESISYWKLACPKKLLIEAGNLSSKQIKWWKYLFLNGLGEFYYTNNIDCSSNSLLEITCNSNIDHTPSTTLEAQNNKPLVLVGGGKDSALTLEILKENASCFLLNPQKSYLETANAAGCSDILIAKRTIDPKLIELNAAGYLNGHTPFSAYLAFLSTTVASINGYKQILTSNESSANEENTYFKGLAINHQYSKSYDFEKKFRGYQSEFLKTGTSYFSFLRPLHEIQITALFSKYKNQHPVFRSCNRGQKHNKWCQSCPKCAFVFLMLYPFISHKEAIAIFGSDYLLDEGIQTFLEENIDPTKVKPLECVGSRDEALLALKLSLEKRDKENIESPSRLTALFKKVTEMSYETNDKQNLLLGWNKQHFLNKEFEKILRDEVKKILISPILIYGYGKEGKSTHEFLQKKYPEIEVVICDKNIQGIPAKSISEQQYFDSKKAYTTLFRSPGIPLHNPLLKRAKEESIQISSLTNIFFQNVVGKTIGVTGTKGKSTTSSLIAHLLKAKYKDVRLVGNIGKAALDEMEGSTKDTIFVFELSSFQLEDLEDSPDTAVLLSIYPEHLDHHQDLEHYVRSKQKIYQTSRSLLISKKNQYLIDSNFKNEIIYFSEKEISGLDSTIHKDNLFAAISVAKKYGVSSKDIDLGLNSFKTLPYRMEHLGVFSNINFINDSLSTIPEACIHAIDTLGDTLETLILGGFDRGINYKNLSDRINSSKIKNLILFPTTGEKIWNAISLEKQKEITKVDVGSMKEAVRKAFELTSPGATCALSPASSSLNMFKNYKDRGDSFAQAIYSMKDSPSK